LEKSYDEQELDEKNQSYNGMHILLNKLVKESLDIEEAAIDDQDLLRNVFDPHEKQPC
jgi:hypothetical protein